MLNKYIRIFCYFQFSLLLLFLLIEEDKIFALPNPNLVNSNNNDVILKGLPAVTNKPWSKLTLNPGKDKLNARQIRNKRTNITETIIILSGSIGVLFVFGGIISIIVYYIKKKRNI